MGMQSFRGAGGAGAYSSPLAKVDADSLGEHELTPLSVDMLTETERRLERALVGVAAVLWIGIGASVVVWLV